MDRHSTGAVPRPTRIEFKPNKPVAKARSVKFISLKDQGDQNPYDDIAVAELMIG